MNTKFFKIGLVVLLSFVASLVYAQTPTVRTLDATNRDVTEARLHGEVNFSGSIEFGQVFFEYGRTELYGQRTPQRQITESGDFDEKVQGLNEDTGYHFRAVVIASNGQSIFGQDKTFITKRESDPFQRDVPEQDDPAEIPDEPTRPAVPDGECDRSIDADCDGLTDEQECPGISQGALCPDTDGDGFPDHRDNDDRSGGVPATEPIKAPVDGENYTDQNGNNCLGSSATPVYSVPGNSSTAIVGYACPGSEGGDIPVGVTVGPISGGTFIPNGTSTPFTGERPTFEDPGTNGIVGCGNRGQKECGFTDAIGLVQEIINWIVGISVIIAVGLVTAFGLMYMTSGGSSDKTKKAKGYLTNGVIGLFFIMFGWLIVNTALNILTPEGDGGPDKIGQDQTQQFLDDRN